MRFLLYLEAQLAGKADATHHTQGVVGKSDVGVERRGNKTVFHVQQPIETVDEFTEAIAIEADGQCIDGEVTTVEIVLQRAVLHDGLTRVVAVTFATGTDEFDFEDITNFHLRRPEVLKDTEMGTSPEFLLQGLGQCYAWRHGVATLLP